MYKFLVLSLMIVPWDVSAAQRKIKIKNNSAGDIEAWSKREIADGCSIWRVVTRFSCGCSVECCWNEDSYERRSDFNAAAGHRNLSPEGRVLEFVALFAALPGQLRK